MKIILNQNSTTTEIQKNFNQLFPLLKIEFFKSKHDKKQASLRTDMITGAHLISDLTKKDKVEIKLSPKMTTADLETAFKEKADLSIQIFRKSGETWLETSSTDNWTLAEQQETAEERSK